MRVLIIFHGRLPGGPHPVAGIALRAWTNGQGLATHGIDVQYASRRRDLIDPPAPGLPPVHPFEGRLELLALVRTLAPDLVLLEGADELVHLRDLDLPIALDLFAPRVLEAQWEGIDASSEFLTLLDGLARADYFLVTTERQRHYYLGLLPLAGVDCREDRIATVPLSITGAPLDRRLARDPLLVSGGVAWPWQDPRWTLEKVVERLRREGKGELHLLRGPYPLGTHPEGSMPLPVEDVRPVHAHGLLNYPEMLDLYRTAHCAVDLMAPNLEREIALSFRQLDALRCGVPMLMGTHAPLAALVREYDAGWVVAHGDEEGLEAALTDILTRRKRVEAKSRNTLRLARDHFDPAQTILPLLERIRIPTRRVGRETLSAAMARRATEAKAQEQQLERMERELATLHADLEKKERELRGLDAQVRGLLDTVGHLSTALEGALYLQRSAEEVRAAADEETRDDLVASRRALETARRELAKKDRELERLTQQRDDLEADIARLHLEHEATRRRADAALLGEATLRGRLQAVEDQVAAGTLEMQAVAADRDKKQREIETLWQVRDRLQAGQQQLEQERAHLEGEVRRLAADLEAARTEQKLNTLKLEEAEASLASVRRELELREAEMRKAHRELEAVQAEVALLRERRVVDLLRTSVGEQLERLRRRS